MVETNTVVYRVSNYSDPVTARLAIFEIQNRGCMRMTGFDKVIKNMMAGYYQITNIFNDFGDWLKNSYMMSML